MRSPLPLRSGRWLLARRSQHLDRSVADRIRSDRSGLIQTRTCLALRRRQMQCRNRQVRKSAIAQMRAPSRAAQPAAGLGPGRRRSARFWASRRESSAALRTTTRLQSHHQTNFNNTARGDHRIAGNLGGSPGCCRSQRWWTDSVRRSLNRSPCSANATGCSGIRSVRSRVRPADGRRGSATGLS